MQNKNKASYQTKLFILKSQKFPFYRMFLCINFAFAAVMKPAFGTSSNSTEASHVHYAPSKTKADQSWKFSDIHLTHRGTLEEYVSLHKVPKDATPRSSLEQTIHDGNNVFVAKNVETPTKKKPSVTVPLEYYSHRVQRGDVGVDLEFWWQKSITSTRFNVMIAMLLLAIAVTYFVAGVIFISHHFGFKIRSPYICENLECQKATNWLASSMNESVDPCDNFYEFACGSYKEEPGEDSEFFNIIEDPAFKLEFGQDSYLAKILQNFKNDKGHDQPIQYYQACLDHRKRKTFRMEAFSKMIRNVFGSGNFDEFEGSPASSDLEEIGAKLFRVMGHGVYVTMSFFAYPYIHISQPYTWLLTLDMGYLSSPNAIFTKQLTTKLLTSLGTPENSTIISEMLEGIRVFNDVGNSLANLIAKEKIDVRDEPELKKKVLSELAGLCPPMGIKLDVYKMIDKFTGENSSKYITYFNDVSEGFIKGLDICFNEDPSKFTPTIGVSHPKTGFVGIWVFGLFMEFVGFMDSEILNDWGVHLQSHANSGLSKTLHFSLDRTPEYQCMESMWKTLGNLPSIRFLESQEGDEVDILQKTDEMITQMFDTTREKWATFPPTEDGGLKFLGQVLFQRGLQHNLMMPLEGGRLPYSRDVLPFTQDHVHNTLIGYAYSIEEAKKLWIGSTNSCPCSKWFGRGNWGFRSVQDELVTLNSPMKSGARFLAEEGAARADKWVNFLGRKPTNYIRFPMTIINVPHSTESLALKHAGISIKIVRTFIGLVREVLIPVYGKYRYPPNILSEVDEIIDHEPNLPGTTIQACRLVEPYYPHEAYRMHQIDTATAAYYYRAIIMNSAMVKIALRLFRDERAKLDEENIALKWEASARRLRMQRLLPGRLASFSEEQIFFLSFARHVCRGSWKDFERYKGFRYRLEGAVLNALMGMKEFSEVWACSNKTFMNLGDEQCLPWTP